MRMRYRLPIKMAAFSVASSYITKFLFPTGVLDLKDGNLVNRGGVKWMIKDGIVYDTLTLWKDVAGIVSKARAERN